MHLEKTRRCRQHRTPHILELWECACQPPVLRPIGLLGIAILFPNTAPPASSTPSGNIHATEMLIFKLKDGKMQELWEEYDELAMRSQMGDVWRIIPEAAALGPRQ